MFKGEEKGAVKKSPPDPGRELTDTFRTTEQGNGYET